MNMLLNLEWNQVCWCNNLDSNSKTIAKEIKINQNLQEWMCLKFIVGMNLDLGEINVEYKTKEPKCMKRDLEFWKW